MKKFYKTTTLLLLILIGCSSLLTAQTKTISFGGQGNDKVFDMVSHDGLNYILGEFPIGVDSLLNIANSVSLVNCYLPTIIVFDDNFNLVNYYCILDSANNQPIGLFSGKLAIDTITKSLYLCGTTGNTSRFGNDIVSNNNHNIVFPFLVRFDLLLNPIWARTSDCNYPWKLNSSTVNTLTIDDEGKPWASISAQGSSETLCFNNDSIYQNGKIYSDSIGNLTISKSFYSSSTLATNFSVTSIRIDSNRIIETYDDNTQSTLQMIDSREDTIIWRKISAKNSIRKTTVDLINRYFYSISDGGVLRKYRINNGSLVFQRTISTINSAEGITLLKDGSKIYISGISSINIHRIYALESITGNIIDSVTWGYNSFSNNFGTIQLHSFQVENNKLKSTYSGSTRFVTFGTDTLNEYRNDEGIFSIVDLTTLLTSTPNQSNNKQSIIVYPNPTFGIININSEEQITNLQCFDIQGRIIPLHSLNGFKQIGLPSNLNKGVYFLEISIKDKKEVVKIIF